MIAAFCVNPALRRLLVDRWDGDRIVSYYEDGPDVDEAIRLLRALTDVNDEDIASEADEALRILVSARERRFAGDEDGS